MKDGWRAPGRSEFAFHGSLGEARPCCGVIAGTGVSRRDAARRGAEAARMGRRDVDATVSGLYEAVLEQRDWIAGIGLIAGMVDGAAAHMVRWSRDATDRVTGGAVWNLDASHHRDYALDWQYLDPRHAAFRRFGPGSIATDHDLLTEEAIAGSPFYQEFLADAGLCWALVAKVPLEQDGALHVALLRHPARGPFGAFEKSRLAALCPHLARAALDRLSEATFLVDSEGVIGFANTAALALVDGARGVRDEGGRLGLAGHEARDRLARRIRAACLAAPAALPGGDTFSVAPAHAGRRLSVTVLPAVTRPGTPAGWAVVTIRDLARPAPAAAAGAAGPLRALFDLTRAEAAIAAAVAAGRAPREIAEERGIATSTVRSQLAAVFRKTGTGRQSELAALVGRIAGDDRDVA